MPDLKDILTKVKPIIIALVLIGLSVASILSFISMSLIVSIYFTPTLSYSLPFWIPMIMAIFLFLSQTLSGYFSPDKRYLLIPLLVSTILVGILFTVLLGFIRGPIFAAACLLGNLFGFYVREHH